MRVIQSQNKRPLDLLAIGARGHIAAASSAFGVQGDVEVWEMVSGNLVFNQTVCELVVQNLGFTPDGEHLLAGVDNALSVLKVSTGEISPGPKLMLSFPDFTISTTGNRLFVAECVNQCARLSCWEFSDGPMFRSLWTDGPHTFLDYDALALSVDGSRVAVVEQSQGPQGHPDQSVHVRDSIDGTAQLKIPCDASSPIEELHFSVDGSLLLARSPERSVKVFDATTGASRGELVHPGRSFVSGMAVHSGGLLACSRNNGTVCLWNVEKRELLRILDWKLGKLVSIAFSPDGSLGAAGTEDGKVILWDMDE